VIPSMIYRGKRSERGVALLVVLLLVTVLSSVAIAMTDDIRFAIRRTANIRLMEQAQWYARGGEALAREVLRQSWKSSPARSTLQDPWAAQGATFAIEGGAISGRIADAGNCFNLNSVVERGPKGEYRGRDAGEDSYRALMIALDIPPETASGLAAKVVDWIDSNDIPGAQGAEDETYARFDPPYRTAGTLLAEPSELRAIAGYTAEIYDHLRPFVCALPTDDPSPININTLSEFDAPLLVMVTEGALRLTEARRLIARRPAAGYGSPEEFLAEEILAGLDLEPAARSLLGVRTRYFMAESTVHYHGATVILTSLMEVGSNGNITTHRRRLGRFD
jgi:general secretion pathway protein K